MQLIKQKHTFVICMKIKAFPKLFHLFSAIDECRFNLHDCDVNANCTDTLESFLCVCKKGYFDDSPDKANRPGRKCPPLIDCAHANDCDQNAHCIDIDYLPGHSCICNAGYLDVSTNPQQPGTKCQKSKKSRYRKHLCDLHVN